MFGDPDPKTVMAFIPVTDRAQKTVTPVERKKKQRTIIVMRENIHDRMEQAGQRQPVKAQKIFSLFQAVTAGEKDRDQDQGRVKKIVREDQKRVFKKEMIIELRKDPASVPTGRRFHVKKIKAAEKDQRKVWQDRTNEKRPGAHMQAPAAEMLRQAGGKNKMGISLHFRTSGLDACRIQCRPDKHKR